jgi:tetratricopeptide (TPR) repeat protein/tRNA A-37 threonylcarbamoyl transferase component Bud32
MSAAESRVCPSCSSPLEHDGMCLVCLLNEGIDAAEEQPKGTRSMLGALPCEFARHRLERELASGGMGIVFEALDLKLKRRVAMKVIRDAQFARREEAARFRTEMKAIARLVHPHIIPVYESGEADGTLYFTMRLAEGGSLAERLQKHGAMPPRDAAAMMAEIAHAVQHAHDRGVLHRDLKPANILLDAEGGPLLADFGLAKQLDGESQLTQSGVQLGTLHYMSPEQAAGGSQEITTASDVWALGVLLSQMLTNKLPFAGGSAVEVIRSITQAEPLLGTHKGTHGRALATTVSQVPADLATLIRRCLEKQPEKRLRSAGFLAEELERFLAGEEIESRPITGIDLIWRKVLRQKAAAVAIVVAFCSLVAGTGVSIWQASEARRQKAESDEIAGIVLDTVRGMDEHVTGRAVDPDKWREELLRRLAGFGGDSRRKASMLAEVATMMTKPSDVKLFKTVLAQAEPLLDVDDPLLWRLRYRLALKTMQSAVATSDEAVAAREELRRIIAWQETHLPADDQQTCRTRYALAEELNDEVGTKEAFEEAERLLRTCVEHYQSRKDYFDEITAKIELMTAQFELGRREEALKLGRETVELSLKEKGAQHSLTGRVLGRLAKHCRQAGLIDESIQHARRALDIYWRTVGPDYVKANATLDALAETLEDHSGHEAVLELRRAALKACDQDLGPLHPSTLRQAAKVIEVLRDLKRLDEAHATAQLWMDRVSSQGHLPPAAAAFVVFDFLALQELGQPAEAEKLLAHLPDMLKAQKWDESTSFTRWEALANRLRKAGKRSEAIHILQKLLEALPQAPISARKAAEIQPKLVESLREAEGR